MCRCVPDAPYRKYVRPEPVQAPAVEPPREEPPPSEEPIPVDWPIPVEAPAES